MFIHIGNQLTIGDFACSLDEFKQVYPKYKMLEGYQALEYMEGRLIGHSGKEATFLGKWKEGDRFLKELEKLKTEINAYRESIEPAKVTSPGPAILLPEPI